MQGYPPPRSQVTQRPRLSPQRADREIAGAWKSTRRFEVLADHQEVGAQKVELLDIIGVIKFLNISHSTHDFRPIWEANFMRSP